MAILLRQIYNSKLYKNLEKIKDNFHKNGFVIIRNVFSKQKINEFVSDFKKIKKISTNVKNKDMHLPLDKRVNSIHIAAMN